MDEFPQHMPGAWIGKSLGLIAFMLSPCLRKMAEEFESDLYKDKDQVSSVT